MRELKEDEVQTVSGAVLPALALGLVGAYMYDAMGGKEGIDRYFRNRWDSAKSSINYWSGRARKAFA